MEQRAVNGRVPIFVVCQRWTPNDLPKTWGAFSPCNLRWFNYDMGWHFRWMLKLTCTFPEGQNHTSGIDIHVGSYATFIEDIFLVMQDNERPLVVNCVKQCMDVTGIRTMDCPARSPGLNPIENTWNET